MFAQPSAAALNHLLTQNSWVLQRLVRFAGKTARCRIAPFSFAYTILKDGTLHGVSARNSLSAEADAKLAHAKIRSEGDIAAERIVQTVQTKRQQLRDTAVSPAQAAAEYWTEECPLLAKPQPVAAFMQQADTLRDDVAWLEQRISRLLAARDQ